MLDTNIASYVIKGNVPFVRERLASIPMGSVAVSAVTQAELLFGLAKKGNPPALTSLVSEFLIRVDVLPWDKHVTITYGVLRASCEAAGVSLGTLDMMIASHAVAVEAILVTGDLAFTRVPDGLHVENWTKKKTRKD